MGTAALLLPALIGTWRIVVAVAVALAAVVGGGMFHRAGMSAQVVFLIRSLYFGCCS
jgi:hypothetical protein